MPRPRLCGAMCEANLADACERRAKGRQGQLNGFAALQGLEDGDQVRSSDGELDEDEAELRLAAAVERIKALDPKARPAQVRALLEESYGWDVSDVRVKETLRENGLAL